MTLSARQTLENIIAYCSDRWLEADKAVAGAVPPLERLTGEKKAYNDVFQFARKALDELP